MEKTAKILHVCPYLKGSHAYFANSLKDHSRFDFEIIGFEDLNWKWSSICSPLLSFDNTQIPGLVLFTDFCNVPGYFALNSDLRGCKSLLYMHENQLTYPKHPGQEKTDLNFVWQLLLSVSWVDEVWFNSAWHLSDFSKNLVPFESELPVSAQFGQDLVKKAKVVYPGIEAPLKSRLLVEPLDRRPLTIVWNHRSDYDKGVERLISLVGRLKEESIVFNWIHLGEIPQKYKESLRNLFLGIKGELLHFGFCDSKEEYFGYLENSDIVISLSDHEFFGISILEAISMNCFPLLPKALSYPELIPVALHPDVFYKNETELFNRIKYFAENPNVIRKPPKEKSKLLVDFSRKFSMKERIKEIDSELARIIES